MCVDVKLGSSYFILLSMVLLQHRDNSVLSAALLCGLPGDIPHSSFRSLSARFQSFWMLVVSCHDIALGGAVLLRSFALPSAVNTARTSSVSSTVFISHNKRHTRKCRCQSLSDVSASNDAYLAATAAAAFAATAAFPPPPVLLLPAASSSLPLEMSKEHDSVGRPEPDDSSFSCFPVRRHY